MNRHFGLALVIPVLTALCARAGANDRSSDAPVEPPPPLIVSTPAPELRKHYDALRLCAKARLLLKERRLVEAAQLYEQAHALEPDAAEIVKALIPLCFQLDRPAKGLTYCQLAVELDPDDFDLAFKYGETLRDKGQKAKALSMLMKAVKHPDAASNPARHAEMLFALGTLQEELNDHAAAAAAFTAVAALLDKPEQILQDPRTVTRAQLRDEAGRTYERLGQARLRAGQFDQAVEAFRQAQQRSPQSAARLELHLAEVFRGAGQLPRALDHLNRYLASQPSDVAGYEILIELLAALGRSQEILPNLEQAVRRDAFNYRLKLLLAHQYVAAQDPERAEAVYLNVMAGAPSEDAYRGLAGLYAQLGRWDDLLRRFDQACADPQRAPLARLQLDVITKERVLVEGLGRLAVLWLQRGATLSEQAQRLLAALCRQAKLHDQAEALYRSLLASEVDPGPTYLELLRLYSETEQFAKEVELCAEALKKKSSVDPRLLKLEQIRALSLSGQCPRALELCEGLILDAAAGSDDYWQARFMRATIHFRSGKAEAAAAEAELCLAASGDATASHQLRHFLSTVYAQMKAYDRAQQHLEGLFAADSDDPIICNDLGYLWAVQGKNLEEAERLIRRAIDLDRAQRLSRRTPLDPPGESLDSATLLDSLAWTLHRRGRHAEAAQLLERAAQLSDGDEPTLHEHRGDVYEKLNEPLKAHAAWQRAILLLSTPKYAGAVQQKQELENKLRRSEIRLTSGQR